MALPSASRIDLADILNYEDLMRNGEKVRWNELASVGLFLFESILIEESWLAVAWWWMFIQR